MLARLFIQNYALIDTLEVPFSAGLNILTGETGAGKSILVGAIGLILGERADAAVVLDATRKCIVEAESDISTLLGVQQVLRENELDATDSRLILRRELAPGGKSRAFINDSPATLTVLRSVAEKLVHLHGQHEGQLLLEPAYQLSLLDAYADTGEIVAQFATALNALNKLTETLQALRQQEADARRQEDYLRFQVTELTEATLQADEDEQLEQQLSVLQHAETITEVLARNYSTLEEGDTALNAMLRQVQRELEKTRSLDTRLAAPLEKLHEAREALTDVAAHLQRLAESTELDPAAQARATERLNTYNKLKLKYAVRTGAELVSLREQFAAQLNLLGSVAQQLLALETESQRRLQELTRLGLLLENRRLEVIGELQLQVEGLLHEVGLPNAKFEIQLVRNTKAGGVLQLEGQAVQPLATGINTVQFKIRTNAGVPMGPLASVASGGEVSRVMLAIKTALAGKMALGTLIFDEIDTGISGEVALRVGSVMQALGTRHQVLTITHLPQIASRSGSHYYIYKTTDNGRAYSRLRLLTAPERADEIAKMIGGAQPSPGARQTAVELLSQA